MNILLIGNVLSLIFTAVNLVEKVSGSEENKCKQGSVSFADFLVSKLIGLGSNSCSCAKNVDGENKSEEIKNAILDSKSKENNLNSKENKELDTKNMKDITKDDLLVLNSILKEIFTYYGVHAEGDVNASEDRVKEDFVESQKVAKLDVNFSQLSVNDVNLNETNQKGDIGDASKVRFVDKIESELKVSGNVYRNSLSAKEILNIIIGELRKLESLENSGYKASEIDGNVSVEKDNEGINRAHRVYVNNDSESNYIDSDKTKDFQKDGLNDTLFNPGFIGIKDDIKRPDDNDQLNLDVTHTSFDKELRENASIIGNNIFEKVTKGKIHTETPRKIEFGSENRFNEIGNEGDTKVSSSNSDLNTVLGLKVRVESKDLKVKSDEVKSGDTKPFTDHVGKVIDKVSISTNIREGTSKSDDNRGSNFQNLNKVTSEGIRNSIDDHVNFRVKTEDKAKETVNLGFNARSSLNDRVEEVVEEVIRSKFKDLLGKDDLKDEKKVGTDNVDAMGRLSTNQQIFKQETKDNFGFKPIETVRSGEMAGTPDDVKPKADSVKIVTMKVEDAPIERVKLQFNSETKDLKVVIVDRKNDGGSSYYSNNDFVELKKNLEELGFRRVDVYVSNSYRDASYYSNGRGRREAFSKKNFKRSLGIDLSPVGEGQGKISNINGYESSIDRLA